MRDASSRPARPAWDRGRPARRSRRKLPLSGAETCGTRHPQSIVPGRRGRRKGGWGSGQNGAVAGSSGVHDGRSVQMGPVAAHAEKQTGSGLGKMRRTLTARVCANRVPTSTGSRSQGPAGRARSFSRTASISTARRSVSDLAAARVSTALGIVRENHRTANDILHAARSASRHASHSSAKRRSRGWPGARSRAG